MPTLYKIYTRLLGETLSEEMGKKEVLPPNQTGFRKGVRVIDTMYVLNYIINRQLVKKGGKMVAIFMDMKAAFNSVDGGVSGEVLRERGIRIKGKDRGGVWRNEE